jgi:hypothetical protein
MSGLQNAMMRTAQKTRPSTQYAVNDLASPGN